jgi:proline racemase
VATQTPVVRSYKGTDRTSVEAAFRADARKAARMGWAPIAHRWLASDDGPELSVVFEQQQPDEPSPESYEPGSALDEPASADSAPEPAASALPNVAVATRPTGEPTATDQASQMPRPSSRAVAAARSHTRKVLETLDLHCAGEPLRLIRSGYPQVPFAPILQRRRWVEQHADDSRRALMYEPRGHRDMYGAVLLKPFRDDADIAVLFMHNAGYSTMCGHGVIALTTGLIEEGLYPANAPETVIRWETPAGLVTANASVIRGEDGSPQVSGVRFRNVPSYRHEVDLPLHPDGLGELSVSLAFGGAYYGIVDAAALGLRVVPEQIDALTRAGAAITELLSRDHTPTHPTDADLGFVYGTIIVDHDPASSPDGRARGATIRNVTIFANAEVDRSPCGSGTSALLAAMHASGELGIGQDVVNAGITGESFLGRVEGRTTLGSHQAVITSIEGTGYVTGYHTFVVDDRDPLGDGFLLR